MEKTFDQQNQPTQHNVVTDERTVEARPVETVDGVPPRISSTRNEMPTPEPIPPRRKGFNWIPLAIIAALLIAGVFLKRRASKTPAGGAGGPNAAAAPAPPTVRVIPVTTGNIEQTLQVTGALKTNQSIDLGSKIAGRVARVFVNEGDRVTRGELLIQLDDADLRAQVAQAQAALDQAKVRYNQAVVGLPARVQGVNTGIVQAQTNLSTAQARLRQARLNESPRITSANSQVQTAQETVRTAQTRLAQARETARETAQQTNADIARAQAAAQASRAALADVIRGARVQQVAQGQAQVAVAQANADNAQTELNRQKILFAGGATAQASVDTAQTAYNVAQAQLENARQALSLTQEGATSAQVTQAREAVRQAEAGVATAETGRSRVLVAQGEITNALAALGQAQAGLQTAEANLAQIPSVLEDTRVAREAVAQSQSGLQQAVSNRSQIPLAREDINAAKAAVESAQAQLLQTQVTLGYARIYSPVNGVVNTKLTNEGQTAGQNAVLLNLVSLDRVYFEAQVSENNIGQIKAGQSAQINVAAVSDKPLTGYVSDVIPTADVRTRQFRVRITIPNAPRTLTPGAFARATLSTQKVSNALLVPDQAIIQSNGQNTLLLATPQGQKAQVKRRIVQTGISQGGQTQIVGGVRSGDQVIIGNTDLDDGDTVLIAKGNAE